MFDSEISAAAWLAGIIDGEGTVWRSNGGREVHIPNTDPALLDGVDEACQQLGIEFRFYDRSERARLGKKPIWTIHIGGNDNLKRLADHVVRHMRSVKADRMTAMIAAIPEPKPIEKAIELYRSGMSLAEVAVAVGMAQSTVQYHVARAGAARSTWEKTRPPTEELAEIYAAAESIEAASQALGVSYSTAQRWIREAGITAPRGAERLREQVRWSFDERKPRSRKKE